MIRVLLGLLLATALWPALAADDAAPASLPLFRVELVVFENLDPAALQAEQWPTDPGTPAVDHALELDHLTATAARIESPATTAPSAATTTPPTLNAAVALPGAAPNAVPVVTPAPALPAWRWLTPPQLRLAGAARKLGASGRYRPLLHVGWIQPLAGGNHGTAVHIYDGMAPGAGEVPPEATAPQPAVHVVDGMLTLWRGHFLHADVDLDYRRTYTPAAASAVTLPPPAEGAQVPPSPAPQPVTVTVRMTESRRLRDGELNYFDHPLFGVLLRVTPVATERSSVE